MEQQMRTGSSTTRTSWHLLSPQALVLLCIAQYPNLRVREIALQVGVTERSVTRHITELEASGLIYRVRIGRCNHYLIDVDQRLDVDSVSSHTVGSFVSTLSAATS